MKRPKLKEITPTAFSTMHSKVHKLVGISFLSSDKEYLVKLPIEYGKKLALGLLESLRLVELPATEDKELIKLTQGSFQEDESE